MTMILFVLLSIDRIHTLIVPGTSQSSPFKFFFPVFPPMTLLASQAHLLINKTHILWFFSPLLVTLFSIENILPPLSCCYSLQGLSSQITFPEICSILGTVYLKGNTKVSQDVQTTAAKKLRKLELTLDKEMLKDFEIVSQRRRLRRNKNQL